MGQEHCFHAPGAGAEFLGWRKDRAGRTEIVFDDCIRTRLVWRAAFEGDAASRLDEALAEAVGAGPGRMIATLFEELRKRSIMITRA